MPTIHQVDRVSNLYDRIQMLDGPCPPSTLIHSLGRWRTCRHSSRMGRAGGHWPSRTAFWCMHF